MLKELLLPDCLIFLYETGVRSYPRSEGLYILRTPWDRESCSG